jgi:hypothetical protein
MSVLDILILTIAWIAISIAFTSVCWPAGKDDIAKARRCESAKLRTEN